MAVGPDPAEVIGLVAREPHDTRRPMQIRVLGPLEASIDDRPVAIGGAKQRAVLAMLVLEANHAVAGDRLIEGLWGDEPPASAAKMVQNYVWRLRHLLPAGAGAEIVTRGRAYELQIDRELVDVCRFERLLSEAARAAAAGHPGSAAREALALFRGDPLADVADEPFADAEIRRIEELRLSAAELAIDADLSAGRHHELAAEIDALVSENPLRERLHAQRMLVLYQCGRQAEALDAFRSARATLVEEVGVEPSAELRRLHEAILRQDPALDVDVDAAELPSALDASAAPPLVGRAVELHALRTALHANGLVALVGAYGMGKTRLAGELAGQEHRGGTPVLYAAGTGAPEAALAVLARARDARRRTLVVVDDADRAPAEVRTVLREVARDAAVVLATGTQAAALAALQPRATVTLEPLDAGGVRAIAGLYTQADAVPVDELLAVTHGVPRRVHEAATEWVRREATRRVDAAAARTLVGRSEARASEAELAGSVEQLQSARERARRATPAGPGTLCPYKGLAPFEADDAGYFFGRERLVAELVARLVGAPLLAIVGPSGSGKSSVMKAGLLPALAGGVVPGSEKWTQAIVRPGDHPVRTLRAAARRLGREWRGLLAIDQFEELFTACHDEGERTAFAEALARLAGGGTVVVLAVRADFYGRCAAYPELSRLLAANHVLVGPMSREELGRAIERPGERAGLTLEPELVEALLEDVEGEPGALPLLSTALLELWRERDGRRLRLAAYVRSGGVQGAVARLAEEAFVGLDRERQAVARGLLVRLADEDESGAVVRRRLPLADSGAEEVIERLADRRLLTVSQGSVEVAHEALLREWPRLRGWLTEDADGRRLHRALRAAARAWRTDGRDPGGLYRGARLAAGLDWAGEHGAELGAAEREFLDASRHASGRAQRRLRMVLAGVVALLVLAVIAGLVALDQRGDARAEATTAAAQRLGAQALADESLDRGMLLARQGVALDDSPQTRGNLLATLLKSPAAIGVLPGHGGPLAGLDLSSDGRTLAFVDFNGTLTRLDPRTRRAAAPQQAVPGFMTDVDGFDVLDFSDDGSLLAVAGSQPMVLDARTRRIVSRLPLSQSRLIIGVRFSADRHSIIGVIDSPSVGSNTIQRFDAATGRPLGKPRAVAPAADNVTAMVVGDRVVTTREGGPTVVRDARSLRAVRSLPGGGDVAAVSGDGRTMVAGSRDGTVRLLDLETGATRTALGRHEGGVIRVALSPDGRTAVTAGRDNRMIVWDVAGAVIRETLATAAQTTGLAITPDGRTLYSGGLDGKVIVWDLAGDRRLGRVFGIAPAAPRDPFFDSPASHAVSPDGRTFAVGNGDGTISIFDGRTLRRLRRFTGPPRGPARGLAFMPSGGLLVVGGDDGYLALFDPRTGTPVERLPGHRKYELQPPSFSADGRRMLTSSLFDTVQIWTLENGRPVGRPRRYTETTGVDAAALSADGRVFAVTGALGVRIVDTATMRVRATLPASTTVRSLALFTPDGRYLVGGSYEGWTRLWSTRTWKPASPRLRGHVGAVTSASTSPDGHTLATGSIDGTVRLYDLESRRALGAPLPAVPNRAVAPEFMADGAYLFAFTNAGRQFRWDVRPASWERQACTVAGRTLSRAEWKVALPGREYEPACR